MDNPAARYLSFEKTQTLEINFDGPHLDALTLAHLNFTLHLIVNKVAILDRRFFPEFPIWAISRRHYPFPYPEFPQIVRLEIDQLKSGSLQEIVTLAIAAVLSDEAARAILQHLAANVIWAIAKSGVRGIKSKLGKDESEETSRLDPFDIGPELAGTMKHIIDCNPGKSCRLKFRTKTREGDTYEAEIDFNEES